ncbi:hypothetical protein [Janthinobacterium sp. Ant5-2-1]|nr:hypothetical protein [Janthinobacterium sp. Ant5-2-1]
MSIAGRKARRAVALVRHPPLAFFELRGTCLLQIPGFFNHPAVGDPFAHHFRMLRGSHGGHGHQVLQLRGIAVVTFHKTAQMLGSVVDELAASDVIMRWYWPLRRRTRDYCQIIPLQRNMRGLIVRQNHVSSMTLRK